MGTPRCLTPAGPEIFRPCSSGAVFVEQLDGNLNGGQVQAERVFEVFGLPFLVLRYRMYRKVTLVEMLACRSVADRLERIGGLGRRHAGPISRSPDRSAA